MSASHNWVAHLENKDMEIVKYLCEFFFGNFWHWLGLVIVLCCFCNIRLIDFSLLSKKDAKEDKGKQESLPN